MQSRVGGTPPSLRSSSATLHPSQLLPSGPTARPGGEIAMGGRRSRVASTIAAFPKKSPRLPYTTTPPAGGEAAPVQRHRQPTPLYPPPRPRPWYAGGLASGGPRAATALATHPTATHSTPEQPTLTTPRGPAGPAEVGGAPAHPPRTLPREEYTGGNRGEGRLTLSESWQQGHSTAYRTVSHS